MIIQDFDTFNWLIDLFDPPITKIRRKGDTKVKPSEVKTYKPDRKIIDFLSEIEAKRFKVVKLINKHKELLPKNFNINFLKTKPLSEETCNYLISLLKGKGVKV